MNATEFRRSTVFQSPSQWSYILTDQNPADTHTKCCLTSLDASVHHWISGPTCLDSKTEDSVDECPFISPEKDKISVRMSLPVTQVTLNIFTSEFFRRFSKWNTLVYVTMRLKYVFRRGQITSKIDCPTLYDSNLKTDSELFIIQ